MIKLMKVTGESMSPSFQNGDFIFVVNVPFNSKFLKPGDVIVFNNFEYGTMIKKIASIDWDLKELSVIGIHPGSIDSKVFGTIKFCDIVGKVVWHIKKKD